VTLGVLRRGLLGDARLELGDRAGHRLLDQLPVKRPINNHRPTTLELDHDPSRPRLIHLRLGKPDIGAV
jgi:hypothetical protein